MDQHIQPQPFQRFSDLAQSFSQKHIKSQVMRALFARVIRLWDLVFGISRHEAKIQNDISAYKDGFWHDRWIFKKIFYPEISCTFLLKQDDISDSCQKAALLISGSLAFREASLNDTLEQEYEAGKPLDMDRYKLLFSRFTDSVIERNRMNHYITDAKPTDYIVIAVEAHFYKLEVLKEGRPITTDAIYKALKDITTFHKQNVRRPHQVGILTALCDKTSSKLFHQIDPSQREILNNALFFIAIDMNAAPTTDDNKIRSIHSDHYANRDYRRSLQIVVNNNGTAGIIVNPHAGIGGTLSASYTSYLSSYCHDHNKVFQEDTAAHFEPINLSLPQTLSTHKQIERLRTEITSRLYPQDKRSVFRIEGIGSQNFRQHKWSSDAAFHCALNLAFYRHYHRPPVVGNFINLRGVKHGDIWRYISTTQEMRQFIMDPTLSTLQKAMTKHRQLIKEQKSANDEFYIGTMTLKRLISDGKVKFAGFIALVLIMQTFIPRFNKRFLSPDIWVSCIPSYPGIEGAGRASTTLSYIDGRSIAGHYMIFPDHIKICIVDSLKKKDQLYDGELFANDLEKSLKEVLSLAPSTEEITQG